MNNAIKDLEAVFQLLSAIPVQGDAVDAMALARSKLRHAFAELNKTEAEGEEE